MATKEQDAFLKINYPENMMLEVSQKKPEITEAKIVKWGK